MTVDSVRKITANLARLKKEFRRTYDGKSHIQEVIPVSRSELFPIRQQDIVSLHVFAKKNPIYHNSYEETIGSTPCVVYEGDINKYWLSSITNSSSCAPFSPTWITSAYVLSLLARELGFHEVVDVGSGDGRVAFCAKLLGMESFSIEIDGSLVDLQRQLATILDFNPICSDATAFDYSSLALGFPVLMIGGIAQMGGSGLATRVLERTCNSGVDKKGLIFTGTYSPKYLPDPRNNAGWGTLIEENNLRVLHVLSLPTVWTFREPDDTPYVVTIYGGS